MTEQDRETGQVRDVHRLDEGALARYLSTHVAGFAGPLTVTQFKGGQSNPTYLLETPGRRYVLRKKPPGALLASAHQIEREYRVIAALAGSGVPVPQALHLCDDPAIIGTPFYLMGHVAGRVFRDPQLPGLAPAERGAVYRAMVAGLAGLHMVDYQAVGLGDFGRAGGYVGRQIDRWTRQYRASETETVADLDRLIAWLPGHVPAADETTIVHGDYRMENAIFDPVAPDMVAVLDWELGTLGHPLSDLAYNCLPYHLADAQMGTLVGLDLAAAGIPGEAEYVAEYCRLTGRDGLPDWAFYLAFSMFRLAAIMQGVYKRGLDGNAASERALMFGAGVKILGTLACDRLAAAGIRI